MILKFAFCYKFFIKKIVMIIIWFKLWDQFYSYPCFRFWSSWLLGERNCCDRWKIN